MHPQEVVASSVSQFAHDRRLIVEAMARHFKTTVPAEVQDFFAAEPVADVGQIGPQPFAFALQSMAVDTTDLLEQRKAVLGRACAAFVAADEFEQLTVVPSRSFAARGSVS